MNKEVKKQSKINIDMWPLGRFEKQDAKDFKKEIKEFNSVEVNVSSGARGPGIMTIIDYASIAIAAGFLAKLGENIYDYGKSKIADILIRPFSEKRNIHNYRKVKVGLFQTVTKVKNIDISISGYYKDKDDIRIIIDYSTKLLKYMKKLIKNNTINLDFNGEYQYKIIITETDILVDYKIIEHKGSRDKTISEGYLHPSHLSRFN